MRKKHPDLEFSEHPRHIFRDTTDLSGGVLAKAIKDGLDNSKFLIVICSPRAAKSEWVCKEVQVFINAGREEYIIPFIVEGEPYAKDIENECFPTSLKTLAGERELLGININENGREAAAIKVVAQMFGLWFDSLWQRFKREEKKRKRNVIASFISAIIILLSIIAYGVWANRQISSERDRANIANKQLLYANHRITKQKSKLQETFNNLYKTELALSKSNADLTESNKHLKEEMDNVVKANWAMMENLASAVAEKAKEKIANGEVSDAILALLEVLPESRKDKKKPYVPQAEVALRIAIDSLNGSSWKKIALPKGREYTFTHNDRYILSEAIEDDSLSILGIYSPKSLQEKFRFKLHSNYNYLSCSKNDKYLAVGYQSKISIFDLGKGKLIRSLYPDDSLFDSILLNFNPIYLNRFLEIGENSSSQPNILTQFFQPENKIKNVQVLDYLPQKNLILYKKETLGNKKNEFCVSYALIDRSKNKTLWNRTDNHYIPSPYEDNNVRLSYNGNYVIISQPEYIEVINTSNNHSRTIDSGDNNFPDSNHATMTKDEKMIFQYCFSEGTNIYNSETLMCVDSLHSFPLHPYSLSFTALGAIFISNYYHIIDRTSVSYLYYLSNNFHLENKSPYIFAQTICSNIGNRITFKHTPYGDILCYNDNLGHKWECANADFIGYTPDLRYIAVRKNSYKIGFEFQFLDVNSGVCMPLSEHYDFLLYDDLLKISRNAVKNLKLSESSRKKFHLSD